MIEREKQKSDQEKKHTAHQKKNSSPSQKENQSQSNQQQLQQDQLGQQHAGMATDPEAMKDQGYIKRIEEKTQKH